MARDGATVVAYSGVGLVLGAIAWLGFSRGDAVVGFLAAALAVGSVALVLRTLWDRQEAKAQALTRQHAATRRAVP